MRRVLESTAATVLSGVILWWVTGPMSRSVAESPATVPAAAACEVKTAFPRLDAGPPRPPLSVSAIGGPAAD